MAGLLVRDERMGLVGPCVVVSRRAAGEIRRGSVWVYRSEIVSLAPGSGAAEIKPGAVVSVVDPRGVPLGSATYSSRSQIVLRLILSEIGLTEEGYVGLVEERVREAISLRNRLRWIDEETDSCRYIFSEADGLPGVIADRYRNLVVLQFLTQGAAQPAIKRKVAEVFGGHLPMCTVIERPDRKAEVAEGLPESLTEPLYSPPAGPSLEEVFRLNGLKFFYDARSGQKTGAFLDQRLNYLAAARYAWGGALDVCTYQGGFALHLSRVCGSVTGIDASRAALEVAEGNRRLNEGQLQADIDWVEGDAFEVLRDADAKGSRYDTIVLDPPAFAKSHRALEGAMRGYKELNLRALRMLSSGGVLITCSCSQHVTREDFYRMLAQAAVDAKRRVQVLEVRGAAPDHPEIVTLAESAYLKCFICRVG